MGKRQTKMAQNSTYTLKPVDLSSVYVPLESLTEQVVNSIIRVVIVNECQSQSWDFSQRTLLIFLLAINKKVEEIEKNIDTNEKKFDEHLIQQARKVRKWLVINPLDWDKLQQIYDKMAILKPNELGRYYGSENTDPYFELTMKIVSYLYSKFLSSYYQNRAIKSYECQ